jgi:hypothetical protein
MDGRMRDACAGENEGLLAVACSEKSATVFSDMNKLTKDAAILVKNRAKGKLHRGLVKPARLCYGCRSFYTELL